MKKKDIENEIKKSLEKIEVPDELSPDSMKEKLKAMQNNQTDMKPKKKWNRAAMAVAASFAVVIISGGIFFTQNSLKDTENNYIHSVKDNKKYYHVAKNYKDIQSVVKKKQYKEGLETATSDDTCTGNNSAAYTTNVQVSGIDEADVVKVDGNRIYYCTLSKLICVEVEGKEVVMKSSVTLSDNEESIRIREIYESNQIVYAICDDMNQHVTYMYTYDMTNSQNPVKLSEYKQDGSYMDSRQTGDYIYLFTNKYISNIRDVDLEDVIPEVNGETVDCSNIYITDEGNCQLMASSIAMSDTSKAKDCKVVVDESANLYMGDNYFYLYSTNWRQAYAKEMISQFSYSDGMIQYTSSVELDGIIRDSFAISERENHLCVLITKYDSDSDNQLIILDENLTAVAGITGIAKGEDIYAARYYGDYVYFITYRNMDPLFVVDLKNIEDPKLVGQVEITGYSDYLHPFGKDKLVGIGIENDFDSQTYGSKVVMFDVSDPVNPKVLDYDVDEEAFEAIACYEYKAALINEEKNIIGVAKWDYEGEISYTIYQWKNDKLEKIFDTRIPFDSEEDWAYAMILHTRGVYVDNTFVLCTNDSIVSYDMEQGFTQQNEISLK